MPNICHVPEASYFSNVTIFNGAKTPEKMHIFAEISHFGFYEFFIQRICNLQRGGEGGRVGAVY
jgi:hypothetical protein